MNANKHTPGPWRNSVNDDVHLCKVYGPKLPSGGYPVLAQTWSHESIVSFVGISRQECIANARLIAAAPELLEACQTFSEWLRREEEGFPAETRFATPIGEAKWREWYYENLHICDLAQTQSRAAIAKATGETP